jgi:hypothetical protein
MSLFNKKKYSHKKAISERSSTTIRPLKEIQQKDNYVYGREKARKIALNKKMK